MATDFLHDTHPTGKMFNSYAFGGYFVYHLAPALPVFIDGRLDIYDSKVWADSLAVEENRLPIEEIEKRYGVTLWVVQADDAYGDPEHLASRLAKRADYALVHFDDRTSIFVKRLPANEAYIREHGFTSISPWDLRGSMIAMRDPARRETATTEIDRALTQSYGSATASIIAAAAAEAAGDKRAAGQFLSEARARQPDHPLLPSARRR